MSKSGVKHIKKVSSDGTISYVDARGFKHDSVTPPDNIKPHPDLTKALAALLPDALEIAGISLNEGTSAEVRHLHIYPLKSSYEFSISFTILPQDGGSSSPTAPKRSYEVSPTARQKRVDLAVAEAINFINGKYNQGELFKGEEDREAKPSAKVTSITDGKEGAEKAAKKAPKKKASK